MVVPCFAGRTSAALLASPTRWCGSASLCSSSASPGGRTHAAFTAGGGVLVGWVILLAAAVLMVALGTIEAVKLRRLARTGE